MTWYRCSGGRRGKCCVDRLAQKLGTNTQYPPRHERPRNLSWAMDSSRTGSAPKNQEIESNGLVVLVEIDLSAIN